jgi:hypothetical protein
MPFFNTCIVFIDDAIISSEGSIFTKLIKMGFEVFTSAQQQSVFFLQELILTKKKNLTENESK